METAINDVLRGDWKGLVQSWHKDLLAGFLVFLIALPLCLGIAAACGYPPIAGIFTAVIGGVMAPFLTNSELTIKGPAAGLIVIAIGCVKDFGGDAQIPLTDAGFQAYRLALGVGVAAGILQIVFALVRSGILGEFFPTSTVHGMLAAIGVIIIAKQIPIALGVGNAGEPLELLVKIPEEFAGMNPEIALIGGISLAILFLVPLINNKYIKRIPAPMIVVMVAIPLGMYFDLEHHHFYRFIDYDYEVGEEFLVPVPDNMFAAITTPDFSSLATGKGWKWVLMFALIGSLESLLSAKAVDTLDPWHRKTNMNRDMLAVGIGNVLASLVGGLPMISEIVRSKANIDNGARTRFANMFHGLFLLVFVSLVPWLIHRIPLAALAAMLVYTGFRLASPREFLNVYKVGREQLTIFVVTLIAVLATDLLIGIAIGIAVKFIIHINNAMPLSALFRPQLRIEETDDKIYVVHVRDFAVFSNWILLRQTIVSLRRDWNVILNLSETRLVDHTVMEKLHELETEFEQAGRKLTVIGLDQHTSHSAHPHSARSKAADSGIKSQAPATSGQESGNGSHADTAPDV
ncbi:MAG: SulP family inorganic anion transporter [Planctomycetes bacterium]|nr:SulP family inorganic anion transporter [Planctomycetota bacterium]